MYQAWPWGSTAAASPNSGYLQPATGQVAANQWPAGYSQYAVTPEIQQQWAAAWASQAQYAYGNTVAVGQTVPTTTAYAGAWPEGYQTGANAAGYAAGADKHPQANEKGSQKGMKPEKPTEELVPKDNAELEKLNQLKAQAEQWKSLRQPTGSNWSYSSAGAASGNLSSDSVAVTTQNSNWSQAYGQTHHSKDQETMAVPSQTDNSASGPNAPKISANASSKEEEEFERQFDEWEKQFEAWKQQNINHPDKDAFAQYEKQWQEWRSQLLQKKEQMQKTKAERLAGKGVHEASQMPSASTADPNASASVQIPGLDLQASTSDGSENATQKMYYQNAPYMYMQPYMYPTNVPLTTPIMSQPFQFPGQSSEMADYADQPQDDSKKPLLPLPGMGDPNMNHDDAHAYEASREDRFKYSQMRRDVSKEEDAMYQNFEGLENPDMFMPGMEGDFEADWNYNRGRGRGGNRSRGRGRRNRGRGRWVTSPEANEMDGRQEMGNQRPGFPEGLPGDFGDRLPFDGYPPDEFREEFIPEDEQFPGSTSGPPRRDFPPDKHFPFHGGPPFSPEEFDDRFPRRPFDDRFPPERKGFLPSMPAEDGFIMENEFDMFPPMGDEPFGPPPFPDEFPSDRPPFDDGRIPPDRHPFDDGRIPPDRRPYDDGRIPPDRHPFDDGRIPPDRHPFDDGRMPSDRHPFDDGRIPPERHPFDDGCIPPDHPAFDDGCGPPFDDGRIPPDRPPFNDGRLPPGRGRFMGPPGMGNREDFPHAEFEGRFGPGPSERMRRGGMRRDGPYRPRDFPPDDGFGFEFPPEEMPTRMPPGKNMRPPYDDPGFGPPGPGPMFHDDMFFEDGPMRFKTIDYTHRPAAVILGDEFDREQEFQSQFESDVGNYRAAARPKRKKKANKKET